MKSDCLRFGYSSFDFVPELYLDYDDDDNDDDDVISGLFPLS